MAIEANFLEKFRMIFKDPGLEMVESHSLLVPATQETLTKEQAHNLAREAGVKLGQELGELKELVKQGKDPKATKIQKAKKLLEPYRGEMRIFMFGALFNVIDRIVSLKIQNQSTELSNEKKELLKTEETLANFIEENLLKAFIAGMDSVQILTRGGKSKLWRQELLSMRDWAEETSKKITEDFQRAIPLFRETRQAAIDRIFKDFPTSSVE